MTAQEVKRLADEYAVAQWKAVAGWVGAADGSSTRARSALHAAIDALAAQAQRAPEVWKLVPIEPTPEMVSAYLAAQRAYCEDMDNYGNLGMLFTPAKATAAGYAAMLAASSTPREAP